MLFRSATNLARNAPMVAAAVQKNCLEHISLMAQEQIELRSEERRVGKECRYRVSADN